MNAEENAFTWPSPYTQKILLILKNKNRVIKPQLSSNSLYNQALLNGTTQHALGRKTSSISHLLTQGCVHTGSGLTNANFQVICSELQDPLRLEEFF